ncbi:PREDICTED: uncharacterized protein LOC105461569 [Wasmannia auropunctata]|uniref:uncharacterized protein LOC105461569 n=1 Tax=Wasmannia auropunctata TaxID=64793 RepID=UPI0005ED6706|nr:PREDICTED: uncharacterized protein LOC105461569 [Wasmannia auropunctata]
MGKGGKSRSLGKKPSPKDNMDRQTKDNSPSGPRTPEERREEGSCPYPPASTSSAGSGAGGTTTPSLRPAIVKMERVNIDVEKLRKSGNKPTKASVEHDKEETDEGHFEKPAEVPAMGKKPKAASRSGSPDLEYVGTMEVDPSSRPSTPRSSDLEFVSYTSASRPRRNSESSRASAKKRKMGSSPEDADENRQFPGRFTDAQKQAVEDLIDQMEELSSTDMAALATEWLEEVESCRSKSANIKGSFARTMKVKTAAASEAIKVLAMRASMEGDSGYMRSKILELQREMREVKEENQQLRLQVQELRSGVQPLGDAVMSADGLGTRGSPGPSVEFYSPMADFSQMMDDKSMANTRRTPSRARNSPPAVAKYSPGEDFFAKLTKAISGAVAGALKEHLPDTRRSRPRPDLGPRRILDRPGPAEGRPSSSVMTESQTEDDGFVRPPASRNRTKNKSRVARELIKKGTEHPNDGEGIADLLPLPRGDGGARPRDLAPPVRMPPATVRRRAPQSAAVAMSFPEGMKFADVVKKARDSVSLEELGIEHTRLRATMSGAVLVEIPGRDMSPKADTLAARLRETFRDSGVRISRPSLRGELRLSGLDASIGPTELRTAMAVTGRCAEEDIRLGQTRSTRNGLRTIWTQCPLDTAMRLAEEGKLRVGWSTAKVDLLKKRPIQCFKCMAAGHVRERCPSEVDRSSCCFNCGEDGHLARDCGRPSSCPICKEAGRRYDHRAGSDVCPPCPPRRGASLSPKPQRKMADRSNAAVSSQPG